MTIKSISLPTICGLLAIIFWSSSVAIIKSLSAKVGDIMPTVFVYLSGGIVLFLWERFSNSKGYFSFSRKYLATCGPLFIICMICFYLAVGATSSQESAIGVGLANYTWPSLTLILSIPILGKKAKPMLILGIILASLGVFFAVSSSKEITIDSFLTSLRIDALAYGLSAVAAFSWAFYSNYTVKLGSENKGNAVYLFMLATGFIVLPYYLYTEQLPSIDLTTSIELFILAATNTLGYLFWDYGIRKGNMILISSFAYLTPLLSTLCTCLYLGLPIGTTILLACMLIVSGAVVCSKTIR